MKKFTSRMLKPLLFTLLATMLLSVQTMAQNYEKYYIDGSLYVKFIDSYTHNLQVDANKTVSLTDAAYFAEFVEAFDVQAITRPFDYRNDNKLLQTFEMKLRDHYRLEEAIAALEQHPEIEYAEKVTMQYIDYKPNDTLYNLVSGLNNWNWHLDVIKAEQAWDITHGDPEIKVAIVDNAIWSIHPDLADKIVLQRDVMNNTNSSNPPAGGDPGEWSHGTHCSGLATAITDNEIGVAGIGFNTSIIAVKAANDNSPNGIYGQYGMSWAMNNGAHVISMSYGGPGFNNTVQNLINAGHSDGIVFVAAAGNDDNDLLHYPSAYNHVISVAATDENDKKADFSNFSVSVDVSAPGGSGTNGPSGLLSSTWDFTIRGYYDTYSGTSMACPMVAGLCSLILSINPDLSPDNVEEILKTTSDDIYELNPDYVGMLGAGRINAYQAVIAVPYTPVVDFKADVPLITPGSAVNFTDLSLGIPSTWNWTFEGGVPATSSNPNPTVSYANAGTYNVTLTVSNDFGSTTITKEDFIEVTTTPAPYVIFAVSDTNACILDAVIFEDMSLYQPVSWLWDIQPTEYLFLENTSATSQNPIIEFLEPGEYTISLTATNANGSNTSTYIDFMNISGMVLSFETGFEDGTTTDFELIAGPKARISLDSRAANTGAFGLHFTGHTALQGWQGGPTNTTPEQAWDVNTDFQSSAYVCNINATEFVWLSMSLDLKQTFSLGNKLSWFRVLANDTVQVPNEFGVLNFNPETNEDPFVVQNFILDSWAGTYFTLTLNASCRLIDKFFNEGDNVFVDNVTITGSMVGIAEPVEVPFDITAVYPNPAKDNIVVSYFTNTPTQVQVRLSSITGQLVHTSQHSAHNGNNTLTIDVSQLPQGMYVMTVESSNGVTTKKVIVE
ncbi:MAG TPA: S8 family serine peptidase [Bacteroidales bacterium]|nr:S8 family serine peptidase [Bacteroidales bacterium]